MKFLNLRTAKPGALQKSPDIVVPELTRLRFIQYLSRNFPLCSGKETKLITYVTLLEAKAVFMSLGYYLSELGVHISIFNWIQGNFPEIIVHAEQSIGETFEWQF